MIFSIAFLVAEGDFSILFKKKLKKLSESKPYFFQVSGVALNALSNLSWGKGFPMAKDKRYNRKRKDSKLHKI